MIGADRFVREVEAIAAKAPEYRIGGTGKDGTCDCIGLVMGAMYALGRKAYDMHCTNYFARYQVTAMKRTNEKELFIGQLLFRARKDTSNLNRRYLPGGRYCTGDMLDYYHAGVVTQISPLRIIECTKSDSASGIAVRRKLSGWQYGGRLRGIDYDGDMQEYGKASKGGEENMAALYRARVATQNDPLALRNAPGGRKIAELERDAVVNVLCEGEWARVSSGDMLGYACAAYLERLDEEEAQEEPEMGSCVTIIDSEGNHFRPVGDWRVLTGSID